MNRALVTALSLLTWAQYAAAQDTASAGHADPLPAAGIAGPGASSLRELAPSDTTRPRPRARSVELSPGYSTRLDIHRIGSFAMLPLFAGEYLLGQRLMGSTPAPRWVKPAHTAGALALGGLFAANTITGVWNLWESRRVPQGRTRRWVHTALMLAADAGFLYTASLAGEAGESEGGDGGDAGRHRNAAIVSMSLATAGTLLMWFVKG